MLAYNEFLIKKRGNTWIKKYKDTVFIGIDPGATTGVVTYINQEVTNKSQLDTGKGEDYVKQVKSIFDYLNEYNPDIIVCEDYRIYEDKSDIHIGIKLYTVELLGIIKAWAYLNDCKVIMQPAIVIKRGFISGKMENWGYPKYSGGHGKNHWHDALKHLFYALLFNNEIK